MATQVQWRGGSTAEHATFTGAAREVTVDTQKQTLVVHDGSTVGGEALLREDQANLPGSVTNGIYTPGTNQVAVATNGTGRLFVDASGNVQIGSSFAGFGNGSGVEIERSTTSTLRLTGNSGVGCEFFNTGSLASIQTRSAIPFTIQTNELERLRITEAGLVGIGTSSPGTNLDIVVGSGTATQKLGSSSVPGGSYLNLHGASTAKTWFIGANYNFAGVLEFTQSTANGGTTPSSTPAMVLSAAGNVGIGVTSPSSALHVSGSGTVIQQVQSTGGATELRLIANTQTNASYNNIYSGDGTNWNWRIGGGDGTTNTLTFATGGSERARIDSSGRLLVGTSSTFDQSARLQVIADTGTSVAANFYSYGADNSQFFIGAARGTVASPTTLNSSDTIGGVYFRGHDGTSFKTGAQIQAQIDGITPSSDLPSRLVFSTTADGASSPTERMRIDSSGTHQLYGINDTLFSRTNRGAGTSYVTFAGVHSSTGPGTGTPSCFIYSNGNIQNTNNSYGAISDLKLKENIVDASSQWDDLKALQVRNYNFKEGQTHTQIGLVAQEAELVSPGLVSESPDRDAEGNDLGTVTKSVNYSVLYMKAVKALQEAMERIENLEASNADLLARVSALESA